MNDEFWETGRGMCGNSPCAWAKRWLLLFFREIFGAEHDVGAVHSVSSPLHHEDTINREIREGDKR